MRAISTAPMGGASPEERSSAADAEPAASASSDRSSTVATGRSILFLEFRDRREKKKER